MGFEAPLVLCDATTAEPDFYLLFLDYDLDSFADMPMRGTISNRVNINKAVGTDATCQAASAYGQRACLQGAQVWRSSRSKRTLAYVWGGRDLRAVAPRSDSANFPRL